MDLRVECFIIGYLNLISSAIATIASIFVVARCAMLAASNNEIYRTIGAAFLPVGITTLLIVAVLFAFTIILLVGLHKRKPGHVKAFIIYCAIFLVISLILLVVNLVVGPYDGAIISSRVIGLLFSTYFIVVLRRYYHQMLEDAAGPPQYRS